MVVVADAVGTAHLYLIGIEELITRTRSLVSHELTCAEPRAVFARSEDLPCSYAFANPDVSYAMTTRRGLVINLKTLLSLNFAR